MKALPMQTSVQALNALAMKVFRHTNLILLLPPCTDYMQTLEHQYMSF
jgi:hypothetical protein